MRKLIPSIGSFRQKIAVISLFFAATIAAQAQIASPTPVAGGSDLAQGKRVALLIGQSDYRGAPLPSAAADVALIAGQLSAAGFDVESAGDLPEQGISERVRSLVERLTLKGQDATVIVYISGRFAQINGENILLPVGIPVERATDATLNGFNMRKLMGALEGVPAKSRMIILDASPAPTSLTKEPTFSPGLAIVEPPEGFLITYSQGPNRHLVDPTSQPGIYSKALLESILQPANDLGDVFKNVRLRVHSETNGLQMPWEVSKVKGHEFAFYAPAGITPEVRPITASISSVADVRSLPRDEAYKQVVATDSIGSYQAFIQAYPDDDAVPTMQYNLALRREAEIWSRASRRNSPEDYWTYIETYPDGGNVAVARARIASLGYSPSPPMGFAPVMYADLPPPLPGREIVASSASMPLELAPRAPRMSMPSTPALVTAAAAAAVTAVAAPAILSRGGGRQIPVAPAAAVRPTWAAPSAAVPTGASISASPAVRAAPIVVPPSAMPVASRPPSQSSVAPNAAASSTAPTVRPLVGAPSAGAAASNQPQAPNAGVRPLAVPPNAAMTTQSGGARAAPMPSTAASSVGNPTRPITGPSTGQAGAPGAAIAPLRAISGPSPGQAGSAARPALVQQQVAPNPSAQRGQAVQRQVAPRVQAAPVYRAPVVQRRCTTPKC